SSLLRIVNRRKLGLRYQVFQMHEDTRVEEIKGSSLTRLPFFNGLKTRNAVGNELRFELTFSEGLRVPIKLHVDLSLGEFETKGVRHLRIITPIFARKILAVKT